MFYTLLPFTAVLFYLAATSLYYFSLINLSGNKKGYKLAPKTSLAWLISFFAVGLHGMWLHHIIDLPTGQNIHFVNLLSFVIWFMSLIILSTGYSVLRNSLCPSTHLSVFIFPLAAISILLDVFFPTHPVLRVLSGHPEKWVHIWLAGLTFSIICMAALQALLLYLQDRFLHCYQHIPNIVKKMPALESTERLLFCMITIGFILLTILCISSIYFFSNIFQPLLLKKILLVFIVWSLLLILLLGRYLFGWRGRKAIGYTLGGFFMLMLIYFFHFRENYAAIGTIEFIHKF